MLASTSEAYGDPQQHPQSEDYWGNVNPVGPCSAYDEAKRFGEALTTAEARRWPVERYATVARGLRAAGHRVVVTAGVGEEGLGHAVARHAGLPPADVLGGKSDVPFSRLAALVAHARAVVVGDTGLAHLATALGTPSVVLFGPVSPRLWARRHRPGTASCGIPMTGMTTYVRKKLTGTARMNGCCASPCTRCSTPSTGCRSRSHPIHGRISQPRAASAWPKEDSDACSPHLSATGGTRSPRLTRGGVTSGRTGLPSLGTPVERRTEANGMPWRWRWGAAAATGVALVLTTGCGAVAERRTAAMAAALDFERALGVRDGGAVCRALAPETREEVAQSARKRCAQGVLDEAVPSADAVPEDVQSVDVAGRQARVVFPADTLFLSLFPGGWQVVAAGCTPRPERPYRCTLKGG